MPESPSSVEVRARPEIKSSKLFRKSEYIFFHRIRVDSMNFFFPQRGSEGDRCPAIGAKRISRGIHSPIHYEIIRRLLSGRTTINNTRLPSEPPGKNGTVCAEPCSRECSEARPRYYRDNETCFGKNAIFDAHANSAQ